MTTNADLARELVDAWDASAESAHHRIELADLVAAITKLLDAKDAEADRLRTALEEIKDNHPQSWCALRAREALGKKE